MPSGRVIVVALVLALAIGCAPPSPSSPPSSQGPFGRYLEFGGTGSGRVDRVEIPVDGPRSADVGAGEFTVEWRMRAVRSANTAASPTCGAGQYGWITGRTIIDRDRWPVAGPDGRDWGVSVGSDGRLAFGASDGSVQATACTSGVDVLDGVWHHVAVQRRAGQLEIWVDGARRGSIAAPPGDLSYPDGVSGARATDPYLTIGAEKHDAGPAYRSFAGSIDDLRVSRVARHRGGVPAPTGPLRADAHTAGLWSFDEPSGLVVADTSGAPGGPADGLIRRDPATGFPIRRP